MTTTREEQRDVVERLDDDDLETIVACIKNGQPGRVTPYEIKAMCEEIIHLRASQAGGVPAGWREALELSLEAVALALEIAVRRGVTADWLPTQALFLKTHERIVTALSASPPPPATALAAWQDISTAPKDGTWVLCLAKRATVPVIASHQFSTGGIGRWIDKDASDFSGHDDPSEAWIEYWNSNSYTPTHWMPLPPRPDDRTNASEAQSGSLNQALPASSVSATDAVEAERAEYERGKQHGADDLRMSQQQCRHLQSELDAAKREIAQLKMARARGTDEVENG